MNWTRSFLVLLLLVLAGCGTNRDGAAPRTGNPKVVATYSVVGDLVRNVAGDRVELITLVGGDGDAHTFEPRRRTAWRWPKPT